MVNMIFLVLAAVVLTFSVERAMHIFFEKPKKHFSVVLISYFLFTMSLIMQLWIENQLIIIMLYMLALFIITFNYKSTMTKRFSAIAGSYSILTAATGLYGMIMFFIGSYSLYDFDGYYNAVYFLAAIIAYLLALFFNKYFTNIKQTTVNLHKMWIPFMIHPFFHVISTGFHLLGLITIFYIINFSVPLVLVIVFFVVFDSLSKSYEYRLKSERQAQEKEYYYAQCQLMQESAKQVRAIQHDMKNHMATIKSYATSGKYNDVDGYLDNLIDSIEKSESYSDTGNVAFDSIINYKLRNAEVDNIQLNLRTCFQ